ncbi:MAG: hypothetical protein ACYDAO_01280 [Thermoplasmataceae archaeon]
MEIALTAYVILRDFHSSIPIRAVFYKKIMISLMIAAILIAMPEVYIFRVEIAMTVYSSSGMRDQFILMVSNWPLFAAGGLLNMKYLTLMKPKTSI